MLKKILKKIIVFLITIEAKLVLRKYKPKIIAVTGSVGKTSTKDAVYAALAPSFYIRKSEKSYNSEIGVPLTVLGCPNAWSDLLEWMKNIIEGFLLIILRNHYPKWLALEVGADRPGDISRIAKWIKPDIVLLTRFPDVPVHVEFFSSPEALIEEKLSLVKALKKNGTLIVNADDEKIRALKINQRTLSYGFHKNADIVASHASYFYKDGIVQGMSFHISYDGKSLPARIEGFLGRQHIYPYIAAIAVGIGEGVNVLSMMEALRVHTPPPGRMRLVGGLRGAAIIDDSYNSSPAALEEALSVLRSIQASLPARGAQAGGKKIAILGDMLELGSYSVDAHRRIGGEVADTADILITIGIRAKDIARGAHKAKMYKRNMIECNDAYEAAECVKDLLEEGDIVLVKGSQSMRMERVVEAIMAEPEKKKELLVRQDDEWLTR